MNLTTDFSILSTMDDEVKQQQVDAFLDTIRSFANLYNCAFWDAKSAPCKKCIVVYGFLGDLMSGACIKADDIEKTVSDWCNDLADWCEGQYSNDPVFSLRVELSDLDDEGGLHIECFTTDDEKDHELYILPIKRLKMAN